jgi:hypothetical protein
VEPLFPLVLALNTMNFTLSAEAEWRDGIARGTDNYILSKTLPVEAASAACCCNRPRKQTR